MVIGWVGRAVWPARQWCLEGLAEARRGLRSAGLGEMGYMRHAAGHVKKALDSMTHAY